MRNDILWICGALIVTALCLINSYLEESTMLQVLWYIGAAVGVIAAGYSGYEAWTKWQAARHAVKPKETPAPQAPEKENSSA